MFGVLEYRTLPLGPLRSGPAFLHEPPRAAVFNRRQLVVRTRRAGTSRLFVGPVCSKPGADHLPTERDSRLQRNDHGQA